MTATFICIFTFFNCNASIYQTTTRWDYPPYRITIWLIDDVMLTFICFYLLTWFYVLLQLYDMRNRWTRTRIGYHPCVTSEPTNQVCYSYSNEWLTINSFYHWQRKKFFISGNRAMLPSYTTWKYEKTISFLMFSAGINWKHLLKIMLARITLHHVEESVIAWIAVQCEGKRK